MDISPRKDCNYRNARTRTRTHTATRSLHKFTHIVVLFLASLANRAPVVGRFRHTVLLNASQTSSIAHLSRASLHRCLISFPLGTSPHTKCTHEANTRRGRNIVKGRNARRRAGRCTRDNGIILPLDIITISFSVRRSTRSPKNKRHRVVSSVEDACAQRGSRRKTARGHALFSLERIVVARIKGLRYDKKKKKKKKIRARARRGEIRERQEKEKHETFWIYCREGVLPPRGRSEIDVQWWA